MGDTYKKNQGTAGLVGVQFQLDVLSVCLLNAFHHLKDWKVSTEDAEAEKYDDIVIKLSNESAVLIQTKHKEKSKITKDQLLSHNSKNSDFSLAKYFFSYEEIKRKFKAKTVIICTNSDINPKGLENMITSQRANSNSLLHYEGDSCSFSTFNENILSDLKASSVIFFDENLQKKNVDKGVITDENMKDFLKNLQLFSSYPDGEHLHKIIELSLSRLDHPHMWCRTSYNDIYGKIEEWFKQPMGIYLTEARTKALLCEIKSDKYCESLKDYKVSFDPMDFHFTESKQIFHVISEEGCLLQMLKICQALQEIKSKKLYVNPDDSDKVQKRIIDAFELQDYTFLIMAWPKIRNETIVREIISKLEEILKKHTHKKVILVGKRDEALTMGIENVFQIDGSITFGNLSKESQGKLLSNENIVFQEEKVTLEELLESQMSVDHLKSLDSTTLERLVRREEVRVGVRPLDLDKGTAQYYISRTFVRETNEMSKRESAISEDSIFDVEEKMVVISDTAGMGKSTILTKLAATVKKSHKNVWVVRINCNDYTAVLRDYLKKNKETISATELLNSNETTKITNRLEELVFSMQEKVVLMLDGVDEISPDYTGLILGLLAQCQQVSNFAKVFITTRPHVVSEFKAHMNVGIFKMLEFTKDDQIHFLRNYWTFNLQLNQTVQDKCEQYARKLISKMEEWMNYYFWCNSFTAIPLQTRMLAEIFVKKVPSQSMSLDWEGCKEFVSGKEAEPKLPENFEIVKLYHIFIEKKRDFYIDKENPSGKPATDKVHIDKFEECLAYHRSLALEEILGETKVDLFPRVCVSKENIEYMLKLGIVQKSSDRLQFMHRTFAEYFVAESILSELKQEPNVEFQKFIIDEILHRFEFQIIRAFLDNLLQEVVDSLPCNIFHNYLSLTYEMKPKKDIGYINLIFLLSKEGCLGILQLILKSIDFKIIRDRVIDVEDWENNRGIRNSNTLKELQILVREAGVNIKDKYMGSPLHMAIERGNLQLVKFLIDQGVDINIKKIDGYTTLHCAAQSGALDIVKYLMELGIDFNVRTNEGWTPLHFATLVGSLDVVKYLVELGMDFNTKTDEGWTVLHFAAESGALDIVKYLVELGMDFNVRADQGRTALHFAAESGALDIVKYLVELGMDFNDRADEEWTVLHFAAASGVLNIVKYLVELGMDFKVPNDKGWTALHFAAGRGVLNIVKYLVELGMDFNVKTDEERTALHYAAESGELDIVKYLVELGIDFNVRADKGWTALHFATLIDSLDIVKYLIELGTDFNVKTDEGWTALHLAELRGQSDTVKYLMELH